jgi:hypothetical protein
MYGSGEDKFLSHSNFINLKKSSYKVVQLLLKSSQEVVDNILLKCNQRVVDYIFFKSSRRVVNYILKVVDPSLPRASRQAGLGLGSGWVTFIPDAGTCESRSVGLRKCPQSKRAARDLHGPWLLARYKDHYQRLSSVQRILEIN